MIQIFVGTLLFCAGVVTFSLGVNKECLKSDNLVDRAGIYKVLNDNKFEFQAIIFNGELIKDANGNTEFVAYEDIKKLIEEISKL